ncbi:MAG: Tol-Pal system beta propeller repeat protein TolB [Comamonadaceae bacterium]|jgi:TolB protein|nr:Tol-Pal system beta propeller repeat protein TolB [Comamonadaceae bacterium]
MVQRNLPLDSQGHGFARRSFLARAGAVGALAAAGQAGAQFRVEVTDLGASQLPIAFPAFRGELTSPHSISPIVRADLERSGMFRSIDANPFILDEATRPDFAVWRKRGADFLVAGRVTRLVNDRFDIRVQLWDCVRGQELGYVRYEEKPGDMRLAAHVIADFIYEKLIGEKSVFATRIAYVTKTSSAHTLWVADSDGQNAVAAFSSKEPIISPSWSPRGTHLAYVSFHEGRPIIYAHELASGRQPVVANFKGSNSAPAWSEDGQQIIATLSRDGGSQIYAIDFPGGREARRVTQSNSIDTEPCCSPDGLWIYFVSDRRGGSPQIYRIPRRGGLVELVTKSGNYNISPAISPDSKLMTYIARTGAGYELHVMDLVTGQATAIKGTSADESPSFSPNGRLILYATVLQGRETLMTTTIDGRIKVPVTGQVGDIREPAWGPFVR